MRTALLLTGSLILCLVLLEAGLRLFTPFPITESSHQIEDTRLLYVLDRRFPDVDTNGFRNPPGEPPYQIIAIGDSHTYGINVSSRDTWPYQLGRMTGKSVYNFGVGSYNIHQYAYLFERALERDPEQIIVALYVANDLAMRVCAVLALDYWQERIERDGLLTSACPSPEETRAAYAAQSRKRIKLYKRTAIGSYYTHLVRPGMRRFLRKHFKKLDEQDFYVFRLGDYTIGVEKSLVHRHGGFTDPASPLVKEQWQNAKRIFTDMARQAREQEVGFGVLIVPSQERVLDLWLRRHDLPASGDFRRHVANEVGLTAQFIAFFEERDIAYSDAAPDLLERLDASVEDGTLVFAVAEGHPMRAGYEAYAIAAARLMR